MQLTSPIERPFPPSEAGQKNKYDPMAGWLSFLMPGLGQVYQGAYARGITLFIAFILVASFRDGRIFLPFAAVLAGFEAYRPKARKEHWSIWERAFSGYWAKLFKDRSKPHKWRNPLYSISGIAGFLCWFLLFAPSIYPFEAQAQLNDTVDGLADRVREFKATKGTYPGDLTEVSPEGNKDPWGEVILVRPIDDGFELISKGRDKQEGTKDDFKYRFR